MHCPGFKEMAALPGLTTKTQEGAVQQKLFSLDSEAIIHFSIS